MRLKTRIENALTALVLIGALALIAPRAVYSQAQALLFGSYSNAAKAVTVDNLGRLNVSLGAGIVTVPNGGTGLAALTIHNVLVGNGTSALTLVPGGTTCVLYWTASSSDPACSATPTLTSVTVGVLSATTNFLGPKWLPAADSTTAIVVGNAAGTGQFVFDTSNSRLAIGKATAPAFTLDVSFNANTSNGVAATNATSGTAATAFLRATDSQDATLYSISAAYTTSGRFVAGHGILDTPYLDLSSGGANPIDFWTNAVKNMSLSSAGQLALIQTGSAAVPLLALTDNNSGFYRSGSGEVSVSASGSRVATFRAATSDFLSTLNVFTGSLTLNSVLFISPTAPTIASGGCTSPAVTHSNGTAGFLLTIGTSCSTVKTVVLTMPASAHFWHVKCDNNTSDAQQAANYVTARATSTTAVTITNYARVTGLQADFTASDTLLCSAMAE